MKRTPLQRKTPMKRAPMKRTAAKKRKRSVDKKIPKESYNGVFRRADRQCEVMADPLCTTRAEEWHHRKLRSQGGEHTVENGLAVCSACHRHIHLNPADSYDAGWLVKSTHDPADVPVTRRGLVVLLTRQGNFIGKEGP